MSDTESSPTEGVEAVPEKFTKPCTLAEKNANGGWKVLSNGEGGGSKGGPGKNIGGTR